jgi:hypothetical protein
MHPILLKLMRRRKIDGVEKMDNTPNPDGSLNERQQFEAWDRILSRGNKMSMEDLEIFLKTQCESIEMKWRDLNVDQAKKAEWINLHGAYKAILLAIDSPKATRESLEKYLIDLTK